MSEDILRKRRKPTIELDWADGTHAFRCATIGELGELEDLCDLGAYAIFQAIQNGTWRTNYIRETIRIGLIGGGMTAAQALKYVQRYVDPGPIMAEGNVQAASMILLVGLLGSAEEDDDNVNDDGDAAKKKETTSDPTNSTSQPSMEPGQQSASRRAKSMN